MGGWGEVAASCEELLLSSLQTSMGGLHSGLSTSHILTGCVVQRHRTEL